MILGMMYTLVEGACREITSTSLDPPKQQWGRAVRCYR